MRPNLQLNDQQVKAVATLEGPLLIIAGAGSGKTRVITHRIAALLEAGVSANQILALTFTNKAAKEMADRTAEITGRSSKGLNVSTFHSFGVRILREWIHLLGFARDFSIYDQSDQLSLVKDIAKEMYGPKQIDLYACVQEISALKSGRIGRASAASEHAEIETVYAEHLRAFNAVDFDDLIVLPTRLLKDHSEAVESLRHRYGYIMVDEFQDTSLAQYRIVHALAAEHRNLCVVGDDDQSIYSWRGADYMNMVHFERDFPEIQEIKLEQNYRSTRQILSAANSVIANNTNRKSKQLWTGLDADRCIEVYFPNDEVEEGRFIARTIAGMAAKEAGSLGRVGILVRTNAIMPPIEEALLSENIAYRVSGGTSFFQRKEIKDLIAYLRICANPDDNVSLLRVINTPKRGIGRKTVQTLRDIAARRSESLYSTLQAVTHASDSPFTERTKGALEEFAQLLESYGQSFVEARRSRGEMERTLERLISEINLRGYIIAENPESERLARFKIRSLDRFASMLERFERDPDLIDPTLFDFLAKITLITNDARQEEDPEDAAHLMTIHAAKGLEFDAVFLAGTEDSLMPHSRAIEEDESNIEEERRLFYVAVTRAKRKLIMTSCKTRNVMRELVDRTPSRFIAEIRPDLIDVYEPDGPVEVEDSHEFFNQIRSRLG